MNKYVLFGLILILGCSILASSLVVPNTHEGDSISILIKSGSQSFSRGLQESIEKEYIKDHGQPPTANVVLNFIKGHNANEILIYLSSETPSEMTLQYALDQDISLCQEQDSSSFTSKPLVGHNAKEIKIILDGTEMTLQDAIDTTKFCSYDWEYEDWVDGTPGNCEGGSLMYVTECRWEYDCYINNVKQTTTYSDWNSCYGNCQPIVSTTTYRCEKETYDLCTSGYNEGQTYPSLYECENACPEECNFWPGCSGGCETKENYQCYAGDEKEEIYLDLNTCNANCKAPTYNTYCGSEQTCSQELCGTGKRTTPRTRTATCKRSDGKTQDIIEKDCIDDGKGEKITDVPLIEDCDEGSLTCGWGDNWVWGTCSPAGATCHSGSVTRTRSCLTGVAESTHCKGSETSTYSCGADTYSWVYTDNWNECMTDHDRGVVSVDSWGYYEYREPPAQCEKCDGTQYQLTRNCPESGAPTLYKILGGSSYNKRPCTDTCSDTRSIYYRIDCDTTCSAGYYQELIPTIEPCYIYCRKDPNYDCCVNDCS